MNEIKEFGSIDEANQYGQANPGHRGLGIAAGHEANSVVVLYEITGESVGPPVLGGAVYEEGS